MTEISIGPDTFRIGRLSFFNQLHISRRIAPALRFAFPLMLQLKQASEDGKEMPTLDQIIEPLAEAFGTLNDADSEFIVNGCLAVVHMQMPDGRWAPVWNVAAKRSQYENIDLLVGLRLTFEVLKENVLPFLPKAPATSPGLPVPPA